MPTAGGPRQVELPLDGSLRPAVPTVMPGGSGAEGWALTCLFPPRASSRLCPLPTLSRVLCGSDRGRGATLVPQHLWTEFVPCSCYPVTLIDWLPHLYCSVVKWKCTYQGLFSCFLFFRFKDSRKDDIWLVDVSMSFFCTNEPLPTILSVIFLSSTEIPTFSTRYTTQFCFLR